MPRKINMSDGHWENRQESGRSWLSVLHLPNLRTGLESLVSDVTIDHEVEVAQKGSNVPNAQ